jgi:predicted RNA-binding protein YlxR (DUF448 family)
MVANPKQAPERTCLATGEVKDKEHMVRFVLAPDGALTPDVACTLPGRGVWVTATREALETVVKKQAFSRGFKQPVKATPELVPQVENLLRALLLHWLALANKSGEAVMGFAKVEAALKGEALAIVFLAADAGPADADKIQSLTGWKQVELCSLLNRTELGRPFGREEAVHVAIKPGGIAAQMQKEIRRLAGFCATGAL